MCPILSYQNIATLTTVYLNCSLVQIFSKLFKTANTKHFNFLSCVRENSKNSVFWFCVKSLLFYNKKTILMTTSNVFCFENNCAWLYYPSM